MTPAPSPSVPMSAFDLPDRLAHKRDAALTSADDVHFASIATAITQTVTTVTERLDARRRAPEGSAKDAVERDAEIRQLAAQLHTVRRFGLDLCLGRMTGVNGAVTYIGRTGLIGPGTEHDSSTVADHDLLLDWRTPAAAPFFAATHTEPMGLASRRRYRWRRVGDQFRVADFWDEILIPGVDSNGLAPDDDSAFIAGLGTSRTSHMRDVLATIAADQDGIIRADSSGVLVVDCGPGTGKTVVALHRAAYLLYSDPRVSARRGGVLVVGPHDPYLAYVGDILPDLGAEGAALCTLRDLVPEGADADDETDPVVAQLKSSADWMDAVERAVQFYEEPPTAAQIVDTDWGDVTVTADDWARAFEAPGLDTPHNEAREVIWTDLVENVGARHPDVPVAELDAALRTDDGLRSTLTRAWPLLDAPDVVGDLWAVPAYLRRCAPWLSTDQRAALRRPAASRWTVSDLPLLDAARRRLGDRHAGSISRRRAAAAAVEQQRRTDVVEEMIAAEGDRESLLTQFVRGGLSEALVDDAALPQQSVDRFTETFAHIVVDEAQELTDAQWQMVRARCPSGSFTLVGDRAQTRRGFPESWSERLERNGFRGTRVRGLRVNYRTPAPIMTAAAAVIRAALPDANVPTSIRTDGPAVRYGSPGDAPAAVSAWLAAHEEGIACVIGDSTVTAGPRVASLTPQTAKGLEFDLVVLVRPDRLSAVDRYVSMTRATQELVILA